MPEMTTRRQILDEIDRQMADGTIEEDAVENVADFLGRPLSDIWAVQDAIICPDDEPIWEYLGR